MSMNAICIEFSYNFCSIALKKYNEIYYKEYISITQTTRIILQSLDLILLENNLAYKDIDLIIFGDYQSNLINLKALFLIIQSLAFSLKIPIIKINSLLSICLEIFLLYKSESTVIVIENNKNELIYYKCFFSKKKDSKFYFENINNIDNLNINEFVFVFNCNSNFINFFKSKYRFIKIKEHIFPKAIYTIFLSNYFIFNKIELNHNNIRLNYLKKKFYKKYKY